MQDKKEVRRENLINIAINNTRKYAEEVSLNRSVPFVNDGLKPVARALAYVLYLYSDKLKNNKAFKSQDVCSSVIGKYHPHSMDSVYATAVKMVEEKGSIFETSSTMSTKVTDSYSAPRYTNIKLSPLGRELFSTIDLCEMVESEIDPNYKMPKTLLARFPYQLFNYSLNIGVGISNSQLPLNPKEVIEAFQLYLENKIKGEETKTEDLMKFIKGPDLYERTTVYMSKESLKHLIDMGVGYAIEVCDVDVIENKGQIIIREVPYRDNVPSLKNSIREKSNNFHDKAEVSDLAKISGIKDEVDSIKDVSENDDIQIIINVDTSKYSIDHVLNELYNKTGIKKAHSIKYIMVDETGKKLELYSIRDIFDKCIDVNIRYFNKKYNDELKNLEKQFEINKVLEKVTRPEHKDFVGKAIFEKNKVELLLNREGLDLTEYEINNILFEHRSILKRLSDRDIILKELEEFEDKKKKILEKLKEENILQDTLNYIKNTIYPLVKDMKRSSKVVYSELSKVTPKPRKIHIPEERIVYVYKNNIASVPYSEQKFNEIVEKVKPDKIMRLTESDFVTVVTEKNHFKINVKSITPEENTIYSYVALYNGKVGNRILGVFPQYENVRDNVIWYFVNNYGSIKTVKEYNLMSKTKISKSTVIHEDEYINDIYCLEEKEVDNKNILLVTRKGFVKLIPLNLFSPKNKESRYNKSLNLEDNDNVIFTHIVDKDLNNIELIIKNNEGESKQVILDKSFIKPVLNKGIRVIKKGKEVVSCTIEGGMSSINYRLNNGEGNYTNIYVRGNK